MFLKIFKNGIGSWGLYAHSLVNVHMGGMPAGVDLGYLGSMGLWKLSYEAQGWKELEEARCGWEQMQQREWVVPSRLKIYHPVW